MRRITAFVVVMLAVCAHESYSLALRGRVLDRESKPISGVHLTSIRVNQSTTTDSMGFFSLDQSPLRHQRIISKQHYNVSIEGNVININSDFNEEVKVSLFDSRGCTFKINTRYSSAGSFSGEIGNHTHASRLLFLTIKSIKTGNSVTCRILNGFISRLSLQNHSALNSNNFSSAVNCEDTLVCTKDGLLRKKLPISLCDADSLLTIYMYSEKLAITPADYPVIDGSTSTQPVGIVLAATLLGTSYGYATTDDGTRKMVAFSGSKPVLADSINGQIVKHNGTNGAIMNVIDGKAALSLVARSPSEDELKHAESLGVSLVIQSCATDAFVFLLNRKNPVNNITFENIRSIYTGAITNWEQLGGINQAIRPYQRERNSGSQEMMLSMVMKELTIIDAPDMIEPAMTGPYNALLKDSAGIGYTVYFYGKNMAPQHSVKFCSIDGVFPDYDNILSRKYCLWSDVYMISRTDLPQTHSAAYLRDYILSPAGQALIKSCGYVPVDQTGIH